MKEKCWFIQEIRPIRVQVQENKIRVSPMTMKYDTFMYLDEYHRHRHNTKESFTDQYGDKIGVMGLSYNYMNGEAFFIFLSKKDLLLWLELYKEIVYFDNE